MSINLHCFTFNAFSENTYIVWDQISKDAWIIDPGCYEKREDQELKNFVIENELQIKFILNTHSHIDHVLGNWFCKQTYNVPLLIAKGEAAGLEAVKSYASSYGFAAYQACEPDGFMDNTLVLGNNTIQVIEVAGHSVAHVIFYFENQKMIIGGDVLFRESIGRTDLPGGNHNLLINNIKQKLFCFPDTTIVWPGHGPETNIGHEKKYNPYLLR